MIKKAILVLVFSAIALSCSGCATILGGIIGHQSGELCAGLAIGAAVDLSGGIARGIGQMTADQNALQRDFSEKSTFDAQKGEITIPISPFNRQRVVDLTEKLKNKFEQNGWSCQRTQKTVNQPWIGPTRWNETWQCATAQTEPTQTFKLKIEFHSDHDTKIHIKPAESSPEQTSVITSQVYEWLEQIVSKSCNS